MAACGSAACHRTAATPPGVVFLSPAGCVLAASLLLNVTLAALLVAVGLNVPLADLQHSCGAVETVIDSWLAEPQHQGVLSSRRRLQAAAAQPKPACNNGTVAYVVSLLPKRDTPEFRKEFTSWLPPGAQVDFMHSVNGYNHTELIGYLLDSGVPFHNLSSGGRIYGMLGGFLSKYKGWTHQVDSRYPYQILMEDDVRPRPERWPAFVDDACARLQRLEELTPPADLLQLSPFLEATMTSLRGAGRMRSLLREFGIRKNNDQQILLLYNTRYSQHHDTPILNPMRAAAKNHSRRSGGSSLSSEATMGHTVACYKCTLFQKRAGKERAFDLARATNKGDMSRSTRISWAEMAMLRLLTHKPARQLPAFGNPPDTDDCHVVKCNKKKAG